MRWTHMREVTCPKCGESYMYSGVVTKEFGPPICAHCLGVDCEDYDLAPEDEDQEEEEE